MALNLTKIHRPLVASTFIARPQLEKHLNQAFHHPLTLITTAAGYGKTSLVSHQMELCDYPNTWLSLEEDDNELGLFLSYFLTAIQNIFSESLRETSSLLNAPNLPTPLTLATSLVNELERIEQPFVLVLDDYHQIKEPSVHELLAELLHYPVYSLRLVIVSRSVPPLPLATYRAQGHLVEIDTQDLCFSEQEALTFLAQTLALDVDSSMAKDWQEKTEGWVTGLQLAVLGIHHQVEAGGYPPHVLEETQYAREYFYNEVFSTQPPEIQDYLLSTAILDRFNAPLCETISIPNDKPDKKDLNGWEFIAWLKKENLFLVSLDTEKGWYRYHRLFKILLENLLKRHHGSEEIALLHARASDWLAKHDLPDEALQHALAANDMERAVKVIAGTGFQLMDKQEWFRLQRWLQMLPHAEVDQSPELLVIEAWIYHVQYDLQNMCRCLRKIEALNEERQSNILTGIGTIQGHYEALRGIESYMAADGEQTLTLTRRACENIPEHHKRARVFAHIFQLGAYQMLGKFGAGLSIYQKNMTDRILWDCGYQYMFMVNLCFIYWIDADLISLRHTAEHSLLGDKNKLLPENTAMGHYFLGISYYCLNDLDRAEENLARVIHDFPDCHATIFVSTSFALALVYQARGKPGKARKTSEAVVAYAIETGNSSVLQVAQAFIAELALRQGRLAEAAQWAKHFRAKPFMPTYLFYLPQLTQIKILLAQDTVGCRQQAGVLLGELHVFKISVHHKVFLIDILAVQALLREAQGDHDVALVTLVQAIELAEPGGWVRPFLDLGVPMMTLFKRLQKQHGHQDYVRQILAGFAGTDLSLEILQMSKPSRCVSLLTNREFQILQLASQRLRDKEIAEQISISPETVKTHMKTLRKKFNVSSRRDAVAKAIDLNILPPN